MMTFVAFAAVAVAAFLAGGISFVSIAVWLEDHVEAPLEKRQAERDDLAAVWHATREN